MITLHLFKADFRSLRMLIFITWAALLLSALPALLATTDNFSSFPLGAWSSRSSTFQKEIRTLVDSEGFLPGFADSWKALASLCAWILAMAVGYANTGWNASRPMKRHHHITAKATLLAATLIIPQILLVTLSLWKLGFPGEYIWKGAAASAGVFVPLHITVCLFGALCGSLLRSVFGIGVLVIAVAAATLFDRTILPKLLLPLTDLCSFGFHLHYPIRGHQPSNSLAQKKWPEAQAPR